MEKLKNKNKSNKDKVKIEFAFFLISFLIMLSFFAYASPLLPDTFSGSVAVDDKAAPAGTKIEVYVDGELKLNHSLAEEGVYTLAVKHGESNDKIEFKISGLLAGESVRKGAGLVTNLDLKAYIDKDGDGINDTIDMLIGDSGDIQNNYGSLGITVNNSEGISKLFSGTLPVAIKNSDGNNILEFDFDFDRDVLDLFKIEIRKNTGDAGSVLIKGVELPEGKTKTAYFDKLNETLNSVCIKDKEIDSISSITSDCSASDETKVACDGVSTDGYVCALTGNTYKISGLKNSGIKQISYSRPSENSGNSGGSNGGGGGGGGSGGGGGGGGGGAVNVCNMDWQCGEWSQCINQKQERICSFVKVPQHAQDSACPDSGSSPQTIRQCESASENSGDQNTAVDNSNNKGENSKSSEPSNSKDNSSSKNEGNGFGSITGNVAGSGAIDRLFSNPKAMVEIYATAGVIFSILLVTVWYRFFHRKK